MTSTRSQSAWANYWCSEGTASPGCIGESDAIHATLLKMWKRFAHALQRRSSVLDLGTGNGAVLAMLHATRPDLVLTGVDAAPRLPGPTASAVFRPGTPIERLPFPDGSFDAVTSQFGIEYADPGPASLQLARVLRPGGCWQLVMHHADSPVVRHNLARLTALRWAGSASGHLERAKAFARSRQTLQLPAPPAFRDAIREAQQRFPDQSVAAEFLTGVLQVLDHGRFAPADRTAAMLDELDARAADEMSRLEDLGNAVRDAGRVSDFVNGLRGRGLHVECTDELRERDDLPPFAWHVTGSKPAIDHGQR